MNDDDLRMSVTYEGEANQKMDEEMIQVVKKHGWDFVGSGYDVERNIRDMMFWKPL